MASGRFGYVSSCIQFVVCLHLIFTIRLLSITVVFLCLCVSVQPFFDGFCLFFSTPSCFTTSVFLNLRAYFSAYSRLLMSFCLHSLLRISTSASAVFTSSFSCSCGSILTYKTTPCLLCNVRICRCCCFFRSHMPTFFRTFEVSHLHSNEDTYLLPFHWCSILSGLRLSKSF